MEQSSPLSAWYPELLPYLRKNNWVTISRLLARIHLFHYRSKSLSITIFFHICVINKQIRICGRFTLAYPKELLHWLKFKLQYLEVPQLSKLSLNFFPTYHSSTFSKAFNEVFNTLFIKQLTEYNSLAKTLLLILWIFGFTYSILCICDKKYDQQEILITGGFALSYIS